MQYLFLFLKLLALVKMLNVLFFPSAVCESAVQGLEHGLEEEKLRDVSVPALHG